MEHQSKRHQRSASQHSKTGPVAHSTPSNTPSKSLRFSDTLHVADGGIDMPDGAALPPTRFIFKRDLSSHSAASNNALGEMERDTIIKQRTELQLLINELRDRDKELNEMVQAHHTEMKAWKEDRSRTQLLEQKCAKLERDLTKRNNQVRELLKKLKLTETDAVESSTALENTRHQLQSLVEEHTRTCQQLGDLEEYNTKLQDSFKDTSQSLGNTEGKVMHLQNQLELKEREAVATNKEQLEKITFEVKTSANEWKIKYTDLKQTTDTLKNELDISNANMDEKDIEMEKLRKQLQERTDELRYTIEREKRKDQMLALQKSKQERTDTELSTLRQMYDLQQHKLVASRKEVAEIKEKNIKYRCSLNQADDSSMFDISGQSLESSLQRSPLRNSQSPRNIRAHSPNRNYLFYSPEQSQNLTGTSTERLQKLLSDSKRLVDTITSNESKSPTHAIAQLSLSGEQS
ncbi:CCDC62 [Bugula neritina]|uniref:CCDC62 n=1 Tax=Bugula neritina TaxID=10212 RepID=A0A7J7K3E7_BUGNE|nr:CCDC62 [Bugula neritina]